MSVGEFDSQSKPATAEYRRGWERCFGRPVKPAECHEVMNVGGRVVAMRQKGETEVTYWNGCPILDEDQRANQTDGATA